MQEPLLEKDQKTYQSQEASLDTKLTTQLSEFKKRKRKFNLLSEIPEDAAEKIDKLLTPADRALLKSTSRHFYGSTPRTNCLPTPYSFRYGYEAGLFWVNAGEACIEKWSLDPDKDKKSGDCIKECEDCVEACCRCYLVTGWNVAIVCPISVALCTLSIPSYLLCCIVGTFVDGKNVIKYALRPGHPEDGYIQFIPTPPPVQKMG